MEEQYITESDSILDIGIESNTVSLEAVPYDLYFRQYGIRRLNQLMNPVFHDLTNASLPKLSIYHYTPESPMLFGPLENNVWFKDDKRLRFIEHTVEFTPEVIGTVVRKPGVPQQYIQAYRRKHRTLRLVRDFLGLNRQANILLVENYCLLNQLYKYRPHMLLNYYKFYNMYHTILRNIDTKGNVSQRQQFIEIRMPKRIESRPTLRQMSKFFSTQGPSRRLLNVFNDDDSLLLFHLWLWLGKERQYSLFNVIKPNNLSKVNLILTDSGKYCILNLGQLDIWRNSSEDVVEDFEIDTDDNVSEEVDTKGDKPELIQMKFYRLINALVSFRNGGSTLQQIEIPKYTEAELNAEIDENDEEEEENNKAQPIHPDSRNDEKTLDTGKVLDNVSDFLGIKKNEPEPVTDSKKHFNKLPTLPGEPVVDDDDFEFKDTTEIAVFDDISDLDADLAEDDVEDPKPVQVIIEPNVDYLKQDAMNLVKDGILTAKEYQRFEKLANKFKTVESPYFENETIAQTLYVDPKVINTVERRQVPDTDWVIDKSMLQSSIENFDEQYIKDVLPRNVTQSIMSLQKAGIAVTDIKRTVKQDAVTEYEELSIKVQPLLGKESTVKIKLPVIDKDGNWTIGGVKYRMRKQRTDKVIRKVNQNRVALTTYYGKLFIEKSERKTFNLKAYLHQQIQFKILEGFNDITDVFYGNVSDTSVNLAPAYTYIASRYKMFTLRHVDVFEDKRNWTDEYILTFDYANRFKNSDPNLIELETKYNGVYFGTKLNKHGHRTDIHVFFRSDNTIIDSTGKTYSIKEFFQFTKEQPIEVVDLKVMGKAIPIGIVLGYYLGLPQLLNLLNVTPRKVFRGQRLNLQPNEFEIRFADETWIFDGNDYLVQLILSGYVYYKRYLTEYSANQFDTKDVFSVILRDAGFSQYVENELNYLERLFIDDISRDILIAQGHTPEFVPLLIEGVKLLRDTFSRPEINMEDMLIKGYQRISGHVYKQLVSSIKEYNNQRGMAKTKFDMRPDQVLRAIQSDPSVTIVDEINPIHQLKEQENLTFSGDGGRTARTLTGRTRSYDRTDLGTISESTVDNSNVATTVYLSANPKLKSLYGETERLEDLSSNPASLLGTSVILACASTKDDPKRANFISGQQSHTINVRGSIPLPLRTGYDTVMAHRVNQNFACVAKENGKVTVVDKNHLVIQYDSGKVQKFKLGTKYGKSTGTIIKNPIVTDYIVGQDVKQGDVVAYNPFYFSRDFFNSSQVLFKNSVLARTVLMESNDTEEDSSAISIELGRALETTTVKTRELSIPMNNHVHDLVKVGDTVEPDSILCTLEDAVFTDTKLFGDEAKETLKALAKSTPRAKYSGKITKIEVLYLGDIETCSESVSKIIKQADKERAMLSKLLEDGSVVSGEIMESIFVDGTPLPNNHIMIRFYIEDTNGNDSGDKLVFGNQLKSVIARTMSGINETESGLPIQAIFGYQSIANRIVASAEIIGTTNTLLKLISQEVIDIYRSAYPKA